MKIVLKKINFKSKMKEIELMLKRFRRFKSQWYLELYSKKLLSLSLDREELQILEKIEDSASLPEIIYLRNLVIERQKVSSMFLARKAGPFDKSREFNL